MSFTTIIRKDATERKGSAKETKLIFQGKIPEEMLIFLMSYPQMNESLIRIMMDYLSMVEDLGQSPVTCIASDTINLSQKWSFLRADPLPALAAKHLMWGNIKAFVSLIINHPYVFLTKTNSADPIQCTLLQTAYIIKEVVLKNREGKTVVQIIEDILEHYFPGEVKKQKDQIRPFLLSKEEQNRKQYAEDKKALHAFRLTLRQSTAPRLEDDSKLMNTYNEFKTQLENLGDWAILYDAEQAFQEDYHTFGGYNSQKNNFYEDLIIGLIQARRMYPWQIQLLFAGMENCKNGYLGESIIVPRTNVQAAISPHADRRLGLHFAVNACGNCSDIGPAPPDLPRRVRNVDPNCWKKFLEYQLQAFTTCFESQPSPDVGRALVPAGFAQSRN